MVKKKAKSKRVTLKDKYKMQKRTLETHRKRKKEAKRDAVNGVVKHDKKKKDPGIPNSWPFKQDLLKDIQRAKEQQQQRQQSLKEKRKAELQTLKQHQAEGGTARTVQELMEQAQRDQGTFNSKQDQSNTLDGDEEDVLKSDGTAAAGQMSRRAYLRELKKVVDTADILLQVLDARDPLGSRVHPAVEDAILSRSDKKMVLVLNKIDLVPKKVVGDWLTYLRRSHPTIAIKASTQFTSNSTGESSLATVSTVPVGMDGLLQLLKNYARTGGTGGKSKTTIVAGIIGYPNVGKSSIINAMKRSRAVGVSSRPGFTTSMQEVVLDRNVRLLDSPGVVFDDRSAMLGNCIDSESIADPIPPVTELLNRCDHASLLMTYNIPAFPPGDTMAFLCLVAKSYGRVLKGGIPDKIAAARSVLKDWNNGKIPFYTEPPKIDSRQNVSSDAVVVSSFGKEFDLSKFDEAIMNSLADTDEMDFVKIEDGRNNVEDGEMGDASLEAIKYFASQEVNDSDDGSDEMDEDSDDDEDGDLKTTKNQARLASAEDYNFDDM